MLKITVREIKGTDDDISLNNFVRLLQSLIITKKKSKIKILKSINVTYDFSYKNKKTIIKIT